jgi:hypothetical protein
MAPLWNRLHPAAPRPDGPSVDDLVAVLAEMGIRCQTEFFKRHRASRGTRAELVAFVRRRLCVTADHDAEIDAWMGDPPSLGLDNMATLWWDV